MEKMIENAAEDKSGAFFSSINNPLKLRFFLLKSLPAAYFSGLKIMQASTDSCTIAVPFKWFTKNPFRSTYFACLAMAAELSTGVLAMAQVYKRSPRVSMLVTAVDAQFYKKATGITYFSCNDGKKFIDTVNEAIAGKESQQLIASSIGVNKGGEKVAEFRITWSFKAK